MKSKSIKLKFHQCSPKWNLKNTEENQFYQQLQISTRLKQLLMKLHLFEWTPPEQF